MRNTFLILLFAIFVNYNAKAEYGGVYIKYELSLKSGEKKVAYHEYSGYKEEFDTLIKDGLMPLSFLVRGQDSIRFYADMITYEYNWWFSEDKMNQQGIASPIYVLTDNIESAKVLDIYSFSYMMGFGTSHSLSDSVWMKEPVVDTASANGYLCYWLIFVHEQNAEIDAILKRLEEIQKPLKELDKEYRRVKKSQGFGYELDRINEQIDAVRDDDLDGQLSKIIGELNKYKVVVIEECSC
ncbi:MAG: hypothetical protein ACPGLV_11315 [Bacteroidia bacterium]